MEKDTYSIDINNMITLCHIIDDYGEFEKRLIAAISPKYNRDFVFKVWNISKGKFNLCSRKAKKFYVENKDFIDAMNKYSNVPTFICQAYGYHGEKFEDFQYFYNYVLKHRGEIPKILELLERLKELGFSSIDFNEKLDFTQKKYIIDLPLYAHFDVFYVDNVELIPSFDYEECISYKTTGSNYEMKLPIFGDNLYFSEYGRKIKLNSLLFDPNTLPEKIDGKHIFDPLLSERNVQKERTNIIKNSVDLSVSISDLEKQFMFASAKISELKDIKNKEELMVVLTNIKEELERLKTLSAQYDSDILREEPLLTQDLLEKEKKLYLSRREWSRMDIF